MRLPARLLIVALLFATLTQVGASVSSTSHTFKKCTGADPCKACKNCQYCKHCAVDGGTCGVCKKKG
jgi:hypothetical protein